MSIIEHQQQKLKTIFFVPCLHSNSSDKNVCPPSLGRLARKFHPPLSSPHSVVGLLGYFPFMSFILVLWEAFYKPVVCPERRLDNLAVGALAWGSLNGCQISSNTHHLVSLLWWWWWYWSLFSSSGYQISSNAYSPDMCLRLNGVLKSFHSQDLTSYTFWRLSTRWALSMTKASIGHLLASECKQHWRRAALAYTLSVVLYLYIGEYLYFGHGTKYVNKAGEDCIAGGGWSWSVDTFTRAAPSLPFTPAVFVLSVFLVFSVP